MNYGCKDKEIPYALCFQPLRFNVNYEKEAAIPRKNDRLSQRLLCLILFRILLYWSCVVMNPTTTRQSVHIYDDLSYHHRCWLAIATDNIIIRERVTYS